MNHNNKRDYQWYFLAGAWMLAMFLGFLGFSRHAGMVGLPNTWEDNLYLTLQLIPMNSGIVQPPVPWELELARFLIPLLTAVAAIKALLDLFSEKVRLFRLRFRHGHVIICGLSRKGFLLTQRLRQQGSEVVVLEKNDKNEWIESCRALGALILIGDACEATLLNRARIRQASALFAVTESDGVNAEIAVLAREMIEKSRGSRLTCLAHLADPQLCNLLKEYSGGMGANGFQLELFNVFEQGARMILQKYPAWEPASSSKNGDVHLLVIGLGRMGEVLVANAARDWWNQQPEGRKRLWISVIDRHANDRVASLRIRYPRLGQACEILPLEMEVQSSHFEKADFLTAQDGRPAVSAVFILLDDDRLGLYTALTLWRRPGGKNLPMVIRVAEESGLAKLLEDRKNYIHSYRNLHAFALIDNTCTPELLQRTVRDLLARAAHEDYVFQQTRQGGADPQAPALRDWDNLEEHYKTANYEYVDSIQALLEQIGFEIVLLTDWDAPSMKFSREEIELMSHQEHDRWRNNLLSRGWQYAPGSRDIKAKTNPDLVDWEQLPEPEKEKNRAQVRGIPAFLSRAGFQLQRRS